MAWCAVCSTRCLVAFGPKRISRKGAEEITVRLARDLNRAYRGGIAARVSPDVGQLLGRAPLSFEAFARENATALR